MNDAIHTTNEMDDAMGYARVSAIKQAVEGDSLALQAALIARAIQADGCRLFPGEVIEEPFTGTTDDRPGYRRALQLLRENPGKVKYFYIYRIDRLTREGAGQYQRMKDELAALGVELRDTSGVIQPKTNTLGHLGVKYKWSTRSPSQLNEVVQAETAREEITTMLTRMIGAEIKLVRDGYHVGNADDGYIIKRTQVEEKKNCILVPDPERARFFRTMFEMRAEGTHSDKEIVTHLNGIGFRTVVKNRWSRDRTKIVGRSTPQPLTVKRFQNTILRPNYCGVLVEKWTDNQPVRARGEALVSIEMYNRANRGRRFIEERSDGTLRILYDQQLDLAIRKRSAFSDRWPFKNIVACPICRRPLWASASRGKSGRVFPSYHCARGHSRYSVRQQVMDSAFTTFLTTLRFVDAFWIPFAMYVRTEYEQLADSGHAEAARLEDTIRDLKIRQNQLSDAFAEATTRSMRTRLEEKSVAIDAEIAAIVDTRLDLAVSEDDIGDFLDHVRQLLEHPAAILKFIRNKAEQLALYRLFFEEFPTYEEIVSGTPRLSATFRVFRSWQGSVPGIVRHEGLNWNTLQQEIELWKGSYWVIDVLLKRMDAEKAKGSSSASPV